MTTAQQQQAAAVTTNTKPTLAERLAELRALARTSAYDGVYVIGGSHAQRSAAIAACPHRLGCYQVAILDGREALSGASLRGRAKRYSGRYARSAISALTKAEDSPGVAWVGSVVGSHGRIMVAWVFANEISADDGATDLLIEVAK